MNNGWCCYNCIRRQVGCHGKCEEYKNFKAENDNRREKLKQELMNNSHLYDLKESRYTHRKSHYK